jgi:predicted HicB family RNase H-like nuclease
MVKRVRISVEVYNKLKEIADARGISVNEVANQLLEKAMD